MEFNDDLDFIIERQYATDMAYLGDVRPLVEVTDPSSGQQYDRSMTRLHSG